MQFVNPMPFQDAVDLIGDKTPIGAKLSSSEWADLPVALRQRAMFSANVENVRFLQRAQDALGDFLTGNKVTLPNGQTMLKTGGRAAFIQQMREFALKEGMGPLDQQTAGGLKDITSERRLGLIFDTQTRQAGDYSYYRQGMDPDVLNMFPAQRFVREIDVKEPRQSHIQYENQVYLKTDPIWERQINRDFGVPWGPWGWGCGHGVQDEDRAEAEKRRLLQPGQRIQGVVPNFNKNLKASTRGLAPELLAKMKKVFGHQITIANGSMSWNAGSSQPVPKQPARKAPAPLLPEPTPAPAAPPAKEENHPPSPSSGATSSPVSDAIQVKVAGSLREAVNTALAAIDQVHDDGALPEIPLESSRKSAFGFFRPQYKDDGSLTAEKIGVRATGQWPALTTVHEIGHFLDLNGIGADGSYATLNGDAEMAKVLEAAGKTEAITKLRTRLAATQNQDTIDQMNYFLKPQEIWARAYAQFIAERSGNNMLTRDLANAQSYGRQWATEDFAPISAAIETMFQKLNWL